MCYYLSCVEIKEYLTTNGRSPFRKWFDGLNSEAAAKVTTAVTRMAKGNLSNVDSVGQGVHEYKINFGPGYRIYFGKDGEELIILLAGGTKKKQSEDIVRAQALWADYKERKKEETNNAPNKRL
jgi:putative addiction module killer protein